MRLGEIVKLGLAGAAGAACAYYLDPDRGTARRHKAADQLAAFARRSAHRAEQKSRYVQGRAQGAFHELTVQEPSIPEDDRTLADKVRSEVLGLEQFEPYSLNIDACDGVVNLRGTIESYADRRQIEAHVLAVPGVESVNNFLHAANEPAPNKESALQAESGT